MRKSRDWIYRGDAFGNSEPQWDSGDDSELASYTNNTSTLSAGYVQSRGLILLDSTIRGATIINTGSNVMAALNGAASPRQKSITVLAVQGVIKLTPSSWTLNDEINVGWRLGVFDQDPASGFVSVESQYTMWSAGGPFSNQAANWADRAFLKEGRVMRSAGETSPRVITLPIFWRGRQSVRPGRCLAIYLEQPDNSIQVRIQPWMRTLVEY